MRKNILAVLMTSLILASFLGVAVLTKTAVAADPASWYTTVPGVLTTDYYSLYPYTAASIDIGLSKFGEVINYPVTTGVGVGLQYPGYDKVKTYNQKLTYARDPFANEYIDPKLWLNGWLIEVRYTHRTERDRYVIAMAMFADMKAYGGDWLVGHKLPLDLAPNGGRKTNAYAETEDLKVLYNGPRLYVAQSVTHLYDWVDSDRDGVVDHPDETWPIVDVKITFVFEKVKKYLMIFKDIKQVISGKELDSPLDIQFSDREEWDLGPAPDYDSYAHFFHQIFNTCYGPEWHLAPGILREFKVGGYALAKVPTTVKGPDGTIWTGPIATGSVRVYVAGVFQEPGRDYDIDLNTGVITWHVPVAGKWVDVIYKLWKDGTKDVGVPHFYDVAQIISSDLKYVGFKAFWPVLSDYTVDGWSLSFTPLMNVSDVDMVPTAKEPDIPMTIGEWDFMLGKGYPEQFRGVEVVGLTDYHDADDPELKGNAVLDREVVYQLTEVFYPWGLNNAVHKNTVRDVKFVKGPLAAGQAIWLDEFLVGETWDEYCSFAERVILLPDGTLWKRGKEYDLADTDKVKDGRVDSIVLKKDLASGKTLKILYSSEPWLNDIKRRSAVWTGQSFAPVWRCNVSNVALSGYWSDGWVDDLGVYHSIQLELRPFKVHLLNGTVDWYGYGEAPAQIEDANFKVFMGQKHYVWTPDVMAPVNMTVIGYNMTGQPIGTALEVYNLDLASFTGVIDAPLMETVHVHGIWYRLAIGAYFMYNATTDTLTVWPAVYAIVEYSESLMGRYEWGIVGRDAHSVDSAGLSMVSAAFKNKQVEYGLAGADMKAKAITDEMPWVVSKFGAGNEKGDYKDALGRAALKDDWCTTWPVASSNMIGVGGPLANMLAYYGNDFTPAFYGLPEYASAAWANTIIALSCWSQNTYASSEKVGYAVVATYKDLNGTVLFLIWGHWGRDTYYATKWFHEEGIYQLQGFPDCATAIILEIDYTVHEPAVSVVEVLGTISERLVEGVKGGIHPDP
jgi:hypothetical protein